MTLYMLTFIPARAVAKEPLGSAPEFFSKHGFPVIT